MGFAEDFGRTRSIQIFSVKKYKILNRYEYCHGRLSWMYKIIRLEQKFQTIGITLFMSATVKSKMNDYEFELQWSYFVQLIERYPTVMVI